MSNCAFCRGEFEHTVLKQYENWQLQLFTDQYYIGRTLVKLDRHAVDLLELEEGERKELFGTVLPELKSALDTLFGPDLYNYAFLGNGCRHLHLHVIPRYREPVEFADRTFRDEYWNSHYKHQEDEVRDEKVFEEVRAAVAGELEGSKSR